MSDLRNSFFIRKNWARLLTEFLVQYGTQSVADRGVRYLQKEGIHQYENPEPHEIKALVKGPDGVFYTVLLQNNSAEIVSSCNCPYGKTCKHIIGLILEIFRDARRFGHDLPFELLDIGKYKEVLGGNIDGDPAMNYAEEFFGDLGGTEESMDSVDLEEPWWITIARTDNWIIQENLFRKITRQRLNRPPNEYAMSGFLEKVRKTSGSIGRLQSFEQNLKEAFASAWGSYKLVGEPDPAFLEFLESDEAKQIQKSHEREVAEDELFKWIDKNGELTQSDSALILWGTRPLDEGFDRLVFHFLTLGKNNRYSQPRKLSSLRKISREIEYGERDFGYEGNKLINWLENNSEGYNDNTSLDEPTTFLVENVSLWKALWDGTDLISWGDGQVEFASLPAKLTVGKSDDGQPQWIIALRDGNETELPLASVNVIIERENKENPEEIRAFVRHNNKLFNLDVRGMNYTALKSARVLGSLPLEKLKENRSFGTKLLRRFSPSGESKKINPWIKEVAAVPHVSLVFSNETGLLTVKTHAESVDDDVTFEFDFKGAWPISETSDAADNAQLEKIAVIDINTMEEVPTEERVAAESSNDDEASYLLTVPAHKDVMPVEGWLTDLTKAFPEEKPDEGEEPLKSGIRLKVGRDVLTLAEWWFMRPAGVEYQGNPAFRDLVTIKQAPKTQVFAESSGMDWLQVSVTLEKELEQVTPADIDRVLRESQNALVVLPGGGLYKRGDLDVYRQELEALHALGISRGGNNMKLHALHLSAAPDEALDLFDMKEDMVQFSMSARNLVSEFKGVPSSTVPEEIGHFLRPYQKEGVDFLVWSAETFGGAILADDMGLGKTLQVLATITALRAASKDEKIPTLVVCPASVAHNWQREAAKFAPSLKVLVLESGAARRKKLTNLNTYDLVILNFSLLRRDKDILNQEKWLAVVCDEAQAIKNPKADVTLAIKSLDSHYRFALTGTPIENRIMDLWSIVDFAIPNYLEIPDQVGLSSGEPEIAIAAHRMLRSRLRPVLIRRLKTEVAPELPERVETRIDCEMMPGQKALYLAEVKKVRTMLENIEDSKLQGKDRFQILAALMRLRQICCDPFLINEKDAGSGKTNELMELLPTLFEAGHKVLLFSQFVTMLDHLDDQLQAAGIRTYKLTGSTRNRQELVEQYEADSEPSVFLISLKAGGVGLNLTSATYVILFDPWWNPAVEAQAIDRTHRIGQDKTVVAYRFVTEGTIEERILELQEKKKNLVRDILEEDSFNRTLDREDFSFLLR